MNDYRKKAEELRRIVFNFQNRGEGVRAIPELVAALEAAYEAGKAESQAALSAFLSAADEGFGRSQRFQQMLASLAAASVLAGKLNGIDREQKYCPICGALHGEPHQDHCELDAFLKTRRENDHE